MNISKTVFMNLDRCRRFAALNEIYYNKFDAVVSFSNNSNEEDLMSYENQSFKKDLLNEMYQSLNEEEQNQEKEDMMLPYFNKLEMISGKAIKEIFSGNVIYDLNTFNQKKFTYHNNGFNFYAFLDGYQEDNENIRIFETKATTSNKFNNLTFNFVKDDLKIKKSFFKEISTNIFVPREDLEEVGSDYYKKEESLFDRFTDIGRYLYDLTFQRYIFENSNQSTKNKEYYLVVLNANYIHDGKFENNEPVYPNNLVTFYNVTTLTQKMLPIIKKSIDEVINRLNDMDASTVNLGNYCQKGKTTECPFYSICYKDIPEKNSIFIYKDRHHGFKESDGTKHELFDLINQGYKSALDVPLKYLNRKNNIIQRNVIESKKPYYNIKKINAGLRLLKYPIYHLDFESFNPPLPRFRGEKPYTQSLFQFSVHIEKSAGVCNKDEDHYGYLSKNHNDNREELLLSLLEIIKNDGGSVLVYNVSFERSRLKELQTLFPKYSQKIQTIIDRLFDLKDIVENNSKLYESLGFSKEEASELNMYHEDLNGSFSIKKVLPIFTNLKYEDLEVSNGIEAMEVYQSLPLLSKIDFEEKYEQLILYCKQDTWAMVEILRGLRKLK